MHIAYDYIKQLEEENKLLKKKIKELQKDHLTGAYNRHYLDTLINIELLPYLNKHPDAYFTVFLLDLKNLHGINRNNGYDKGDIYIKDSIKYVNNVLTKNKIAGKIFRIGGDEFLIILPSKKDININKLKYKNYHIAKERWDSNTSFQEVLKRLDKSIIVQKRKNVIKESCRNCIYKKMYENCIENCKKK